ncbi:hypothetical protein RR48_02595 [Papilio machaon]|uniref:Uncharacterized protein n=1 Tax=Papilio machaon TaxID=76193 RepID=A0A0N0PE03_PAPMA|nr:hypothetical protein RR48_02595 [Papilio machaon]
MTRNTLERRGKARRLRDRALVTAREVTNGKSLYASPLPVVLFVVPIVLVARVTALASARKRPPGAPLTHARCAIPPCIDPTRHHGGRYRLTTTTHK